MAPLLSFAVGLALRERVARALNTKPAVGAVLVIGVGLVVSATLTPGREALERGVVDLGSCDVTRIALARPADLLRLDETFLKILLFMPLGLALGWLPGMWRRPFWSSAP